MTGKDEELSEELKEAVEHRDMILDVRAILATSSGRNFFRYLVKSLDVGELPEIGLDGNLLMERLGFLRAGNSIFKLLSEANHEIAGNILADVEKERYERLYKEARNR